MRMRRTLYVVPRTSCICLVWIGLVWFGLDWFGWFGSAPFCIVCLLSI